MATTRILSLTLISSALLASPLRAACPQDLCDCLGAAAPFDVVSAKSVAVKVGRISASGSSYPVEASVSGDVCGVTGKVTGTPDAVTSIGGDLIMLETVKTAVSFSTKKISGVLEPGSEIEGDLITGGGAIKNLSATEYGGTKDTTGTHPKVPTCQQAQSDALAASQTLSALTGGEDLGKLTVKGGGSPRVLAPTGGGTKVYTATSIAVLPMSVSGSPYGSELSIDTSQVDSVVINTLKLRVGALSAITASDPDKVIINVTTKSGVSISHDAVVDPIVLAPLSTISVKLAEQTSALYGAKVTIQGAQVAGLAECPPICGNGVVSDPEDCDPPGGSACVDGQACNPDCSCPAPICGNSVVTPPEQCDPPGAPDCVDGQACNANCTCPAPICGNGVVTSPEQCDPPGSACPGGVSCEDDCTCPTVSCCAGIVNGGQICLDAVEPDASTKCSLIGGTLGPPGSRCDGSTGTCGPARVIGAVCCECPLSALPPPQTSPPWPHPQACAEGPFTATDCTNFGCTPTIGGACDPVSETCGASPSGAFVGLLD